MARVTSDSRLAKIDDLKKLPLVEIEWADAASDHAWATLKEARDDAGPVPCLTVGRLVSNGPKFIAVAQTIAKHGKVSSVWSIPRGWVKRVRRLR